jgi:uncharacterized protein (DUF885 family)
MNLPTFRSFITVVPAQATGYKIGMLEILHLRQEAEATLGAAFDLKAFHTAVLQNGSLPLEILNQVMVEYLTKVKE